MSAYTDFVEQPILDSVVIFEIDLGEEQDFWIALEAGIWMFKVTNVRLGVTYDFENGAFGYGSFEGSGGPEDLGTNAVIKVIGSFEASGDQYTSVSSLANLRSTNKSFWYDAGSTIIYVHFDGFDPPDVFTNKKIGVSSGFATSARYLSDNYYSERLQSIPQISFSKDPLFWELLRYASGSVTLINSDGYFDQFSQGDIFGQPARIKFGSTTMAYADFQTLFTGYVEKYTTDADVFHVTVTDGRKQLDRKIPDTYWDDTTYPDIKPSNIGKPIPLAWGTLVSVPVIAVDEEKFPVTGTYTFKICDTTGPDHSIKSIDTVYVNGSSVTFSNVDLDEATFTVLVAAYDPGDDVTVDMVGYEHDAVAVENALDVIVDILEHHAGVTYSSDTYNTTEWEAAELLVADVALFVHKQQSLISLIECICVSVAGSFIVQNDGKYTFKLTDEDAAASMTILQDEQFGDPRVEFQTDRLLTSCLIEYAENHGDDVFMDYVDQTRESAIFDRYQTYRERVFETKLNSLADATALAVTILDIAEEVPTLFSVVTTMRASTLGISDNIVMQVDRVTREWWGLQKCELVGISYDLDALTVELVGRRIESV